MSIYHVQIEFAVGGKKIVAETRNEQEARIIANRYDDAKGIRLIVNGTQHIILREAK